MKKCCKGFSLVELLVAMAISGIVLASIFEVFNTSQQNYIVQDEVAEMQQNVRVAKMFLARDVRMAGSGAMNMSGPNSTVIYPLEFYDADGTTGTDKIVVMYEDQSGGGCGTPPAGVNSCSDLPPLTLSGSMPSTSTTANIDEEIGDSPYNLWLQNCYCNGTTYTATQLHMPFIITSSVDNSSAVLICTKTSNTGSLDNLGNGPNTHPETPNDDFYNFIGETQGSSLDNKTLNTFPAGSTITFFNSDAIYRATYYIQNDIDGTPCLMRDTNSDIGELIAENVEDLQGNFGLDTNDDGSVDTWINNADLTDVQKDQVRLATISILARTARENRKFTGNRPALEDHAIGGNDGYRRRLLTFTVKIRNFGLD